MYTKLYYPPASASGRPSRRPVCNSILYNLPNRQIERLQRIQNQAARMLKRIPRRNHITPVNHVLAGLPTGLLDSTLYSILFFTQSSSLFLITCSYHLSLLLLMTVVIGSTPTNSLNSSLVFLSFMETPHIHLICCIFVFLKYTHSVC